MNLDALYKGAVDEFVKVAQATNTPAITPAAGAPAVPSPTAPKGPTEPGGYLHPINSIMQGGNELYDKAKGAFGSTANYVGNKAQQAGKFLTDPNYRDHVGNVVGSSAANTQNSVTHNGFFSGLKNGYRDTSIKNTLGNFWNDYKPWIIGGAGVLGGGALLHSLFSNNNQPQQGQQPITINNNIGGQPSTPRQFSFDKADLTG